MGRGKRPAIQKRSDEGGGRDGDGRKTALREKEDKRKPTCGRRKGVDEGLQIQRSRLDGREAGRNAMREREERAKGP